MQIEEIKEMIAERYGFEDNILGNRWDFAMKLTHRTKKQIELYEEVIKELSERQQPESNKDADTKQLNILHVSQQRKLLKAFLIEIEEVDNDNTTITDEDAFIGQFLKAFNCG